MLLVSSLDVLETVLVLKIVAICSRCVPWLSVFGKFDVSDISRKLLSFSDIIELSCASSLDVLETVLLSSMCRPRCVVLDLYRRQVGEKDSHVDTLAALVAQLYWLSNCRWG